jgi:hypothetical protein
MDIIVNIVEDMLVIGLALAFACAVLALCASVIKGAYEEFFTNK